MSCFTDDSYFADLWQAVNPTQDFVYQHASTSASSQRADSTWPGLQELILFATGASAADITSEMIADEAFINQGKGEQQLDPQIPNFPTASSASHHETSTTAPPTFATTSSTMQEMQPNYTLQPTSDTQTPVCQWPDSATTTPGEEMNEQIPAALASFIQQARARPNILQHPPINPFKYSTQPGPTTTSPSIPPSDQGGFYHPLPFPPIASSSFAKPPAEVAPRKGSRDSGKKTSKRAKPYENDNLVGLIPIRCLWEGCNQTIDADRKQWNAHFRDHEGGSNDNICCWEGCNRRLSGGGIVKHAQAVHTRLQDLKCNLCEFRGRRDMMKRHVKNNHPALAV